MIEILFLNTGHFSAISFFIDHDTSSVITSYVIVFYLVSERVTRFYIIITIIYFFSQDIKQQTISSFFQVRTPLCQVINVQ